LGVDLCDALLPEVDWLGVWIINAKGLNALRDPEGNNANNFCEKSFVIIIKINWIDILIFLGGFSAYAIVPSARLVNHS